jgi:AcrR family transcriptional regulator
VQYCVRRRLSNHGLVPPAAARYPTDKEALCKLSRKPVSETPLARRARSGGAAVPAPEPRSEAPAPGRKTERASQRKPSRAGLDTRRRLLDAAERLFAEKEYDGTSLRDIADEADLHGALSTYHFGSKDKLFDEVIRRRAIELERMRLENLEKIDMKAQSASDTVRLLIEAYVSPMIKARYGTSRQWQAHVRLMATVVSTKRWTPLIRRHYDHCADVYLQHWRETLPEADQNALLNAFSFMVVTTLYVCSYTNRFAQWRGKRSRKEELAAVQDDLIQFVHAGFMQL